MITYDLALGVHGIRSGKSPAEGCSARSWHHGGMSSDLANEKERRFLALWNVGLAPCSKLPPSPQAIGASRGARWAQRGHEPLRHSNVGLRQPGSTLALRQRLCWLQASLLRSARVLRARFLVGDQAFFSCARFFHRLGLFQQHHGGTAGVRRETSETDFEGCSARDTVF